jgi:hypothetical protein
VVASFGREQPDRIAMRDSELAERLQGRIGQDQVAILGSFATMNVHHHPPAVDVGDLEVNGFANPQSERVAGPEEVLQTQCAAGIDDLLD